MGTRFSPPMAGKGLREDMLTKEQVLEAAKNGKESKCIDGRDYSRLVNFFPCTDWGAFGFCLKDGAEPPEPTEWTRDNILARLKSDTDFGFEKALGKRGISAGLMWEVVKMWLWVLEDPLLESDGGEGNYAQYGLPLFKAVAVKYGFENPIGDDYGDEYEYSSEYDDD